MNIQVLHILNSTSGGSASSTLELIDALSELGVTSHLVCDNNGTIELRSAIKKRLKGRLLFLPLYWTNKKIRAKAWKRPLLEVYHSYRTWRGHKYQGYIQDYIKEHRIDLIHTSTILNPEGAIAARALGLPHIWHVRELVGPDKAFRFYNYKKWSDWISRHVDILVANSAATYESLQVFFSDNLLVKIPNAITVSDFDIENSSTQNVSIVGMVGNVTSKWKNHQKFIEVASYFKDDDQVKFHIYGKLPGGADPYLISLKDQIEKLGLNRKVKFCGFGSPPEIMAELDILLHPTELESFGRIFVEAMAAAKPVIGINSGGATEMIRDGENGFLCKPDAAHLAKSLQQLLADPESAKKMGQRGRDIATAEFDLPILAKNIYDLYTTTLSKRSNATS